MLNISFIQKITIKFCLKIIGENVRIKKFDKKRKQIFK